MNLKSPVETLRGDSLSSKNPNFYFSGPVWIFSSPANRTCRSGRQPLPQAHSFTIFNLVHYTSIGITLIGTISLHGHLSVWVPQDLTVFHIPPPILCHISINLKMKSYWAAFKLLNYAKRRKGGWGCHCVGQIGYTGPSVHNLWMDP
jgi:hypothetical protein